MWTFHVRSGENLRWEDLRYGSFVKASYAVFRRLRDEGVIESDVRFQVALPAPSSAINAFFDDPSQWPQVHRVYTDALEREIERMLEGIPAEDLVIQYDLAWEVVHLSMGERNFLPFWPAVHGRGEVPAPHGAAARAVADRPAGCAARLSLVLRHLGRVADERAAGPAPVRGALQRRRRCCR
jgi:hypothetical protein